MKIRPYVHCPVSRAPDARFNSKPDLSRTVFMIGGDARQRMRCVEGATIRSFASSQYGGANTRNALTAIKTGPIDLVVLLVRWLGHSERHAIVHACKARGVRCIEISRGMSTAWRAVECEVRRGR
jgi:hypothetical protein